MVRVCVVLAGDVDHSKINVLREIVSYENSYIRRYSHTTTGFPQSRKEERLVKNRKTSKGISVVVSVKKSVESTVDNRLIEVVQIQRDREEGKDSLKKKMMNTCSERKQPEKVPVKAVEKRQHSGSKKSKAKKTVTKSPNHGQNPGKTQK